MIVYKLAFHHKQQEEHNAALFSPDVTYFPVHLPPISILVSLYLPQDQM